MRRRKRERACVYICIQAEMFHASCTRQQVLSQIHGEASERPRRTLWGKKRVLFISEPGECHSLGGKRKRIALEAPCSILSFYNTDSDYSTHFYLYVPNVPLCRINTDSHFVICIKFTVVLERRVSSTLKIIYRSRVCSIAQCRGSKTTLPRRSIVQFRVRARAREFCSTSNTPPS